MTTPRTPQKTELPPPPAAPGNIAIIGLGLMGASLGLCLRHHRPDLRVLGYARREETIREALARDMIQEGSTDPADILPQADLTVICLPIRATIAFTLEHLDLWQCGSVVTDVGSVKGAILDGIRRPLRERGVHFIGSHPMAGTENSGLRNAKFDLYYGAVVFLTEVPGDAEAALHGVAAFWESIGMEPHRLQPDPHDMLVARTSHVLHLLSYAAAHAYLAEAKAELATGGGFRDFTRIAASSPDMWTQVFQYNREHVLAALDEFLDELQCLRRTLTEGEWDALTRYLEIARDQRRNWHAQWLQRLRKTT